MMENMGKDISDLNHFELEKRKKSIQQDKILIKDKINYWKEQLNRVKQYEGTIISRQYELKDICEICGINKKEKGINSDCLRTLPDNRKVCKKCWTAYTNDIMLKNANAMMRG